VFYFHILLVSFVGCCSISKGCSSIEVAWCWWCHYPQRAESIRWFRFSYFWTLQPSMSALGRGFRCIHFPCNSFMIELANAFICKVVHPQFTLRVCKSLVKQPHGLLLLLMFVFAGGQNGCKLRVPYRKGG
jgi:hypothetical protein